MIKMNWKEFLKPDWRKIVLIIILIGLILPYQFFVPNMQKIVLIIGIFGLIITYQLLIPDLKKIVLTVILMGLSLLYIYDLKYATGVSFVGRGFPATFYRISSCTEFSGCLGSGVLYDFLVIDIIFWYLISCLMVWIFIKRKEKR
jgi:hypothetical protein